MVLIKFYNLPYGQDNTIEQPALITKQTYFTPTTTCMPNTENYYEDIACQISISKIVKLN